MPPAEIQRLEGAIGNPASLARLPPAIHDAYVQAFTHAIERVFIVAAAVGVVAFLLSWLIEQRPLRETVTASTGIGESFAVPKSGDSLAEMARALSVLIGRDARRRMIEQLVARAGVDLSAAAAWLLARMSREPENGLAELCRANDVPLDRGEQARAELLEKGMIVDAGASEDGGAARYMLTAEGRQTAERLIAERRASLARLLDGWEPETHDPREAIDPVGGGGRAAGGGLLAARTAASGQNTRDASRGRARGLGAVRGRGASRPIPGPGEILVRIAACGVCHSDLHVHEGNLKFPLPCVLGHEVSGTVVGLGDGVSGLREGDRVVAASIMPCGQCRNCVGGREELCEQFFAQNRMHGTLYDGRTRLFEPDGSPIAMYSMAASANWR